MKKIICVLLVLLLLPIIAFADDEIVGSWYWYFDKNCYPELASNYEDSDFIMCIYTFWADGTVSLTDNVVKDKVGDPSFGASGKWEKDDSVYNVSLVGLGVGNCFIENDYLYILMESPDKYAIFRRMIPFNPYTDYVRK